MKNLLVFLFFLLNGFIWLILVPIWHFPDEQAHFGQVAFIAEKGKNPIGDELDLTQEVYDSELLLGTARDKFGNNKFTFHPDYRIEYTGSFTGLYEASISALSKTLAKNTFIHQESSRYPKLYYIPAAFIYKLFYSQDLFTRVYTVRFWSLLLFMSTFFITYKIGKLLFPKDQLLALILTILVGFQPMMVFSNAGVNSDALGNLLFTLFLFICLKIILSGIAKKSFFLLIATSILAIYAKPQFMLVLPSILILFLYIIFRDVSMKHKNKFVVLLFFISSGILYLLYLLRVSSLVIINRFLSDFNIASFIKFTWEYTFPHTVKEVLPWYWGIYDWLGVTYSRVIHRIINRIVILAVFGFGYWLFTNLKEKKWRERSFQGIIFLIFINVFYFLAISIYDWLSWYTYKYPLGVQGRYFFPLISTHMLILLLGWQSLFPLKYRVKEFAVKIFGLFMVLLNFYGIYTLAGTYYDTVNIRSFINQVSQYKPWFFKGTVIEAIFIFYIVVLILFIYKYIQIPYEKEKQNE